jgi:hypothetical protein
MKKTMLFICVIILLSGALTLIQYKERLAEASAAAQIAASASAKTPAAQAVPVQEAGEEEDDIWDGECH